MRPEQGRGLTAGAGPVDCTVDVGFHLSVVQGQWALNKDQHNMILVAK